MIKCFKCVLKKIIIFFIFTIACIFFWIYRLISKKKILKKKITLKYGINLYGPKLDRGLGEVVRSFQAIAKKYFPVNFTQLQTTSDIFRARKPSKSTIDIIVGNPDYLVKYLLRNPIKSLSNFKVGYWFWELEDIPFFWKFSLRWVDEIWVSSDYNYKTFSKFKKKKKKIPFNLSLDTRKIFSRNNFNIPKNKFLFLYTFDYASGYHRKNPEDLIKAFIQSFDQNSRVLLIIKSVRHEEDIANSSSLKKLISSKKNIIYIDEYLEKDMNSSLIKICDAYVSLHRSEGLGLAMAEAMYYGKPVLATNYSGNLEFMNHSNSLLINCRKVNVNKNYMHDYDSSKWASPDIMHASACMENVFYDKVLREKIAIQAKKDLSEYSTIKLDNFIKKRFSLN